MDMIVQKESKSKLSSALFAPMKSREDASKQMRSYILLGGFFLVVLPLLVVVLMGGLDERGLYELGPDLTIFFVTQVIMLVLLFVAYKYKSRVASVLLLINVGSELLIRIYNKVTDQHPSSIILSLVVTYIFFRIVQISFYWHRKDIANP